MSWDERIARARRLAVERAAASHILTFYANLAEYQRSLAGTSRASPTPATNFADALDVDAAAAAVRGFLRWLIRCAPPTLARVAAESDHVPLERWQDLMRQRVAGDHEVSDDDGTTAFVVEAILQPFAEQAASAARAAVGTKVRLKADTTPAITTSGSTTAGRTTAGHATDGSTTDETAHAARPARCPVCGGRPVVAALREEGHGARRTLICALCLTEWDYLRVKCPACEEHRFDALPVYTADSVPHVRVDACDSCHTYMKTIDLAKDGLAVPLVDDLATVSLDLWARDQGYRRWCPNLLRL